VRSRWRRGTPLVDDVAKIRGRHAVRAFGPRKREGPPTKFAERETSSAAQLSRVVPVVSQLLSTETRKGRKKNRDQHPGIDDGRGLSGLLLPHDRGKTDLKTQWWPGPLKNRQREEKKRSTSNSPGPNREERVKVLRLRKSRVRTENKTELKILTFRTKKNDLNKRTPEEENGDGLNPSTPLRERS